MGWKVYGRLGPRIFKDSIDGLYSGVPIRTDAIRFTFKQELLRVARISRQKIAYPICLYDNRNMIWGMARSRYNENITGFRYRVTLLERANGDVLERYWTRREPLWPPMRKIPLELAGEPLCTFVVVAWNQDVTVWKVVKAACMIRMKMGQYDRFNVLGLNADLTELRTDLLLRIDIHTNRCAIIWMPARKVIRVGGARRVAGVDDDDAF